MSEVTNKLKEEWKPEPAESFPIEFGNAKGIEFQHGMIDLGFRFNSSESTDNEIVFRGERLNGDGSKIEIRITKGEKYKSPMQLAKEEAEREERERALRQPKA